MEKKRSLDAADDDFVEPLKLNSKQRKRKDDSEPEDVEVKKKYKKKEPMKPKAERKLAKAKRKAAKAERQVAKTARQVTDSAKQQQVEEKVREDKRSRGRLNDYVITSLSEERKTTIWAEVQNEKAVVCRADEKMPMSDCWKYGARKGYSYYALGHGKSQLKLTQLALWMTKKQVNQCLCSNCETQ